MGMFGKHTPCHGAFPLSDSPCKVWRSIGVMINKVHVEKWISKNGIWTIANLWWVCNRILLITCETKKFSSWLCRIPYLIPKWRDALMNDPLWVNHANLLMCRLYIKQRQQQYINKNAVHHCYGKQNWSVLMSVQNSKFHRLNSQNF